MRICFLWFIIGSFLYGCSEPIAELNILELNETGKGTLEVKYEIRTMDGSDCSLRVHYLIPGGSWLSASEGSGSDGTDELSSSNDWTEHKFVWDYTTDLGPGKHSGVKLRLVPYTERKGYGESTDELTVGEPLVAVALSGDDEVAFVDPITDTVIFSVAVGGEPSALAQSGDGLTVVVANRNDNTVTVIDISGGLAGSVFGTVNVGTSPSDVALTAEGTKAFTANSADGTVSVVDITTLTETTISVGNNPVSLALPPPENVLYVANADDDTVSVVDLTTLSEVTMIDVGDEPTSVSVTPDNTYLLVACRAENTIWVFKTSSLSLPVAVLNVGSEPVALAVTSDSATAFCANYADNSVSFINLESLTVTDTVTVSKGPTALSVSYDDTTLFVACDTANKLDEVDIYAINKIGGYSVGEKPSDVAALKK